MPFSLPHWDLLSRAWVTATVISRSSLQGIESGLRKLSHSWLTAPSGSGKLPDPGKEPFQRGIINKQLFTLPIWDIKSEGKRTGASLMFFLCAIKEELKGHLRGCCQMLKLIPHSTLVMISQAANLWTVNLILLLFIPLDWPILTTPTLMMSHSHIQGGHRDEFLSSHLCYPSACAECFNQCQHMNPHH